MPRGKDRASWMERLYVQRAHNGTDSGRPEALDPGRERDTSELGRSIIVMTPHTDLILKTLCNCHWVQGLFHFPIGCCWVA